MVDVVVDQKPFDKPAYDQSVIPKAVRKRADAVAAFYAQQPQQSSPDGAPPQPSEPSESQLVPAQETSIPQVPDTPVPVLDPAPAVSPPPPPQSDDPNILRSRTLSKEGRQTNKELAEKLEATTKKLEAYEKDLGQLQEQYYREIVQAQRAMNVQQPPPPPPLPQYLTPDDEKNYGRELLDVSQRAALQAIAPHLQQTETRMQQLARENADLRAQQIHERRRILDSQVEQAIPDYREFDRNPRWHKWLLGIDLMSGRVRQQLLNEAISAGNAPRVLSFFRGFQNEEIATGHQQPPQPSPAHAPPKEAAIDLAALASPGRARLATGGETSVPADKPFYTRDQLKALYSQHRRGVYVGREAEWARIDADIIAASREGRIRQ
jgi:hypothetical protein